MQKTTLIWFRRNLRLTDNAVLQAAAARGLPPIGVFMPEMPSETANSRRTLFHCQAAAELAGKMAGKGIPMFAVSDGNMEKLAELAVRANAQSVLADEGYTPSEIAQENRIWRLLDEKGIMFERINDRAVFAKADLMSEHGRPYLEFAPYKKAWLAAFRQRCAAQEHRPSETAFPPLPPDMANALADWPTVPDMAETYRPTVGAVQQGGETAACRQWQKFQDNLEFYPLLKDFPAKKATSQLGAYLAAGCLPPRMLAQEAAKRNADAWLENLIRRDFYYQLVFHRPEILTQPLFGREDAYADNPEFFRRWSNGETGFPLVDVAMRCLKNSGLLPPVLRRIVAEFWCGTLRQDWRQGAAWFARQQTDDDEALNIGNWQEAAGLLTLQPPRAADPVFRSQQTDPDGTFIRRHIPELAHLPKDVIHAPWLACADIDCHGYPLPMVEYRKP